MYQSHRALKMSKTIRILVADDHPVVRDGLVAMLSTQPDFIVIGEAGTGAEAVDLVNELAPDVVLLDLEMPVLDGVEALRRIQDIHSSVKVIVITAFDTDERILGAIKAGAKGYLLKGAPREDIFDAVRVVNRGDSLLHPVITSKLLDQIASRDPSVSSLTPRELEVLQLLALSKTNREISETLFVTERTSKFHVSSILGKLGASNRPEAVAGVSQTRVQFRSYNKH